MKTAEELNTLKEEVEIVRRKLTELTDEELEQVIGGAARGVRGIVDTGEIGYDPFEKKDS